MVVCFKVNMSLTAFCSGTRYDKAEREKSTALFIAEITWQLSAVRREVQ